MKRKLIVVSVVLAAAVAASTVFAQVITKTKPSGGKQKDIVLTTADMKDSYKVVGIVSARGGEVNLDGLNAKLKDAARDLGADCVIGINYFNYSGYVYAYGTAIKLKE
ncbi:MAG: hypothetical protein WC481_05835 [Candidatus Omnitrophota bacterium]